MRPITARGALLGLVLFACLVLPLLFRRQLARAYEAALVLGEIRSVIAGTETPARLKVARPAPTRTPLAFTVGGRAYRSDLYRPGDDAQAGIVLVHGAHRMGKDEPRLVAFALALARARFVVLVPDVAALRAREVRAGTVRDVTDALAYLTSRPDLAPHGRAGVGAFSVAAGPAILAALDPAVRDRVRFVLAVGGYLDVAQVLVFFATGYHREDGRWRYLEPSPDLKWLLVRANLGRLASAEDREVLGAIAERKIADPQAGIDDLAPRLGPEGEALYRFVESRDPHRARQVLAQLPAPVRAEMRALDLANRDLSRLRARLILVHGLDDNIIPYTQSIALARAVPPGRARLFLLDRFAHIERAPGWLDGWRMWRVLYALLAERERDPNAE